MDKEILRERRKKFLALLLALVMLLPSAGLADIVTSEGSDGRTVTWNITMGSYGLDCNATVPKSETENDYLTDIQDTLGAYTPATCAATGTQIHTFSGKYGNGQTDREGNTGT